MKKKEQITDERGAAPCKYCKKHGKLFYPNIVEITGEDLYYAQCPNCKNKKWDIYEFLGTSERKAIQVWNNTMNNNSGELR